MATMSIEDALAGATFDNKDEFVAALRAAAVTDPQRVYRYGGYALLRVPMGERESKSFIDTKLKPHDAKLTSDDADVLTSLADFVEALRAKVPLATAGAAAPDATTTTTSGLDKEKALADAYAQERYSAVAQATLFRIAAKDRLASKIIKKLSDEINRGTISAEHYRLAGLSTSLAHETERATSVGNDVSIVTAKAATFALGHSGEIIIAEVRFLDGLMAAAFRPVSAHSSNPKAGSLGTKGIIEVPDPKDAGRMIGERWNVTPEFARQYLMAVVTGTLALAPADLVAARNRFWELTVEILEADCNVESAGLTILERHTMVRARAVPARASRAACASSRNYFSC